LIPERGHDQGPSRGKSKCGIQPDAVWIKGIADGRNIAKGKFEPLPQLRGSQRDDLRRRLRQAARQEENDGCHEQPFLCVTMHPLTLSQIGQIINQQRLLIAVCMNNKLPRVFCTAILPFARGLRGFSTQQRDKADRIMADRIMRKTTLGRHSSMILSGHDSVSAGCGFAALCLCAFLRKALPMNGAQMSLD